MVDYLRVKFHIVEIAETCLFLLVVCFSLSGCANKEDEVTEYARQYFEEENVTFAPSLRSCLIIPGGGCSGCIASGLSFLRDNQESFSIRQSENMVVLTNIVSRKLLRRNLEAKSINASKLNAVVDTGNVYMVDFRYNDYPLVVYLENGSVVRVEYQSAETKALRNYGEFLHGRGE